MRHACAPSHREIKYHGASKVNNQKRRENGIVFLALEFIYSAFEHCVACPCMYIFKYISVVLIVFCPVAEICDSIWVVLSR